MKILKLLNRINFLAIGAYIPCLFLFYDDLFFGKDRDIALILLIIIDFLVLFICGIPIMIVAEKKNVKNSVKISELKKFGKAPLITALIVYAIGIIVFAVFVRSEMVKFYIIISTICLGSAFVCKAAIETINTSPFYKCSIPWVAFPIPFILFFGGTITLYNTIESKRIFDVIIIVWFIFCGLMLLGFAWFNEFIIDENDKTIQKDNVITFLKKESHIALKNVDFVIEKKLYFLINDGKEEYKIYKFFSNTKRLRSTLEECGIEIMNSNLI